MKMSLIAALLLASSVPALAQEAPRGYAEVSLGATFGQNISTGLINLSSGGTTAVGRADIDFGTGLAAGAELGYGGWGFPGLRLGAAYEYLEGNFESATISGTVNGTSGSATFTAAQLASAGVGSAENNMHLATANAYYDLPGFGPLQPYIGGGIGATFIEGSSDATLALTATAGLRFPVSDHTYLGLRYRFYRVDAPTVPGITFDPITAHSVMATIGMNFD